MLLLAQRLLSSVPFGWCAHKDTDLGDYGGLMKEPVAL